MPDPLILLRIIAGESVFGMDIDSRIRKASNGISARLMIELFNDCDDSKPGWEAVFAESLSEITLADPGAFIEWDDGRWQGDEPPQFSKETTTHYLKLTFREQKGEYLHVRLDAAHPDDFQLFLEGLGHSPNLIVLEDLTEETIWDFPTTAIDEQEGEQDAPSNR